ncbi:MAG TPA: RHS repeat-associated core domain-containing protein [Terriglobia bacterium]|nr:RHS repeat-associated core domain-containing protein [Terriglobia bacterium]
MARSFVIFKYEFRESANSATLAAGSPGTDFVPWAFGKPRSTNPRHKKHAVATNYCVCIGAVIGPDGRPYIPAFGRWMSPRPPGLFGPDDLNRYQYAQNNPTNMIDSGDGSPSKPPLPGEEQAGDGNPPPGCFTGAMGQGLECGALPAASGDALVGLGVGSTESTLEDILNTGLDSVVNTLKNAFSNPVETFVNDTSGSVPASGANQTITGFRAVSEQEMYNINDTGQFAPAPSGAIGKGFFNSEGQAWDLGNRVYGEGNFGVVQGDFPPSVPVESINPATEGPGFWVPNDYLPLGTPTFIWP